MTSRTSSELLRQAFIHIREDRRVVGRSWRVLFNPGFHAVAVYRLGQASNEMTGPLGAMVSLVHGVLHFLIRTFYQIEVPATARIGRRFRIEHQSGVVIGPHACLGDDCRVEHNVTVGETDAPDHAPVIGDRVYIGSGSVIYGGAHIGSDAHIHHHSVVSDHVDSSTGIGPPPSLTRPRRARPTSRGLGRTFTGRTDVNSGSSVNGDSQRGHGRPLTLRQTIAQIRDDLAAHKSSVAWLRPGWHAVVVYRLGRWLLEQPRGVRYLLGIPYGAAYWLVRMIYQIELPRKATVGARLVISHQGGVVISHYSTIGDDCRIRHNVTLGGRRGARDAPSLGNRVSVAPGAVLTGKIRVGDNAKIGPNAVVHTDVPEGAVVLAPDARVLES